MCSDDSVVETFANPHANAGDEERDALEGEVEVKQKANHRFGIRKSGIEEFGSTPSCPKCRAYRTKRDKAYREANHTEACRMRFHKCMVERDI